MCASLSLQLGLNIAFDVYLLLFSSLSEVGHPSESCLVCSVRQHSQMSVSMHQFRTFSGTPGNTASKKPQDYNNYCHALEHTHDVTKHS